MNRRGWLQLTFATLPAACRREGPAAVEAGSVWQPLTAHWQPAAGGELSFPSPGQLRLQSSESLSATKWTGPPVKPPFEIEFEARRLDGTDFFCGLTFPARAGGECLTWIVGGWGGNAVGLSSIDGKDASENETTFRRSFEKERWYRLRLKCSAGRIEAWIDDEQVIDFQTTGRKLGLRPGPIDQCAPFGLATWQTSGEFRSLRWRPF
ncbi:family 16 glycoside hydrolase [Luteolibacter soli]|uniref:Family 16 glycoside hydrolase n=1 Tax=Luteolibacter soli TaxID=3135280 RepID=A0ABU9B3Q9_9BACT